MSVFESGLLSSSGRKSAAARRRSQHSHPLAGAEPFVFNFDFDVAALF